MANVNDALMRRGKGAAAAGKRKWTGKPAKDDEVPKRKRSSTMASWLSPVKGKPRKQADKVATTAEPEAEANLGVLPTSAQPQKPTQSYIDLGQRDFGKHVTCPTCGLLYTAGEEEDEREHQKFCRYVKRGVTFSKWKNERVRKTFPDTEARIIEICGDDPPAHVKKLMEVKAVLDDALGFVEHESFLQRNIFVYIQEHKVVGCVTSERITEAFQLDQSASNVVADSGDDDSITVDGAVTASAKSQPAVVGICQLWVHPKFRRKSVATRMVDAVREKAIYGMHVAKNLIAFAQPTRNGLLFAKKYQEPCQVLIY